MEATQEPKPDGPLDMEKSLQMPLYITVFEWTGPPLGKIPRTFMRHSGVALESHVGSFEILHVVGTPGIGLTFEHQKARTSPLLEAPELLTMHLVGHIPREDYDKSVQILKEVPVVISWSWNCQNWVQEGLRGLVAAGLVTQDQMETAVQAQQEAVHANFTTETPNKLALD
jgi:hypothetical protein